jgi:hypothetical protein
MGGGINPRPGLVSLSTGSRVGASSNCSVGAGVEVARMISVAEEELAGNAMAHIAMIVKRAILGTNSFLCILHLRSIYNTIFDLATEGATLAAVYPIGNPPSILGVMPLNNHFDVITLSIIHDTC